MTHLFPPLHRRIWIWESLSGSTSRGNRPIASNGFWWRGPSYSPPPKSVRAPRRPAVSADDEGASSVSYLSNTGAGASVAALDRRA